MNGGVKVAVELAALDDFVGVAGAVELELVHAVFRDHVKAGIAEVAKVFWPGERESAFVGFEYPSACAEAMRCSFGLS